MSEILETVEPLMKEARVIRRKILEGEDVLRNTERLISLEAIIAALEKRLGVEDKANTIKIPDPYPITITCHNHKFIQAIEIPNGNYINYINIKIKGTWTKIYFPLEYL